MRNTISFIIIVIFLLSLGRALFAVEEGEYVRFAADSIITLYDLKGNPNAMELWTEKMQKEYPNHTDPDWFEFTERLKKESGLKDGVYKKILDTIRSRGYDAQIIDRGGGVSTIEIIGE